LVADVALDQARRVADESPDAVLAVVGPTASGKTELAIRLAESLGGEIVSADSVQIYRSFDLGSGKPTAEEQARARHHLIDALDPLDPADAARFAELARTAIADVRARGKRPIVCGGTFLWVKALLYGLADAPPASEAIRDRHRALAEEQGRPALHVLLQQVDPVIATRLHPNDFVRVSRALEVHELTGEPMSAWQARHGFAEARVPARLLALRVEPEELTRRIAARVDAWLAAGWREEVRSLVERGYGEARAMGAVGFREVRASLIERTPPDDLAASIVRSTRIFARRQRTWLHHADVMWLEIQPSTHL
jgi:tRNA dimethylallyltransferase